MRTDENSLDTSLTFKGYKMAQYQTPGVYIVEKNAFPNSVVEVATAVPAFIGHTETASHEGASLSSKPWRITSLAEYEACFGGAPRPELTIVPDAGVAAADAVGMQQERQRPLIACHVELSAGDYLLYHSMQLFFQNGGGACYVVSVGNYHDALVKDVLAAGIDTLLREQEPTMLVIPDAVRLPKEDCYSLQQKMLLHCGDEMKNRFALLDVYGGDRALRDSPVEDFRNALSSPFLAFGAAYYPWLNTTIVALQELNFTHLDPGSRALLADMLRNELALQLNPDGRNASASKKATEIKLLIDDLSLAWDTSDMALRQKVEEVHNAITALSKLYGEVLLSMQRKVNLLPPGAAMAGLYTMIDSTRGVWKAPANVGLMSVSSPAVNITHDDQEDLNVSTTGKSINAIRNFIGEGTLVWGARTLDGNSLDWRYINVRRTMIMLEESLRLASKAYVFEPNVANTWVTIKSMMRNFLTGIWKRGGLAGASPDEAFSVAVGLDETMTADDILEGILRVTVLVAISRPAEFIEITFQQQMQK